MLVQDENGKMGWIVSPGLFGRLNAFCYPRMGWLRRVYSRYDVYRSLRLFTVVVFMAAAAILIVCGYGEWAFLGGLAVSLVADFLVGTIVAKSPLSRADLTEEHYAFRLMLGMFMFERPSSAVRRELNEYVRRVERFNVKDIYDEDANLVPGVEQVELEAVELWRRFQDELGVDIDCKFSFETIAEVARAIEVSDWRELREEEMERLQIRRSDLSGELTEVAARIDWLHDVLIDGESSMAKHAARRTSPE